MRCEHYWREGILLVERGRSDPHRDDCLDCRRAHEARGELVRTLQLVGAGGGDPQWKARVWRRLDRDLAPRARSSPGWLPWVSAFAAACVLVLFVSGRGLLHRDGGGGAVAVRPRIDIVRAPVTMRSDEAAASANIGDHVRMAVAADQEARIYRGELLLLRCAAAAIVPAAPVTAPVGASCARDDGGVVAEYVLRLPGAYQLLIAPAGSAEPTASLDRDLAAIRESGGGYQLQPLSVR